MPIYVYECASCGEQFEYRQSLSEPPKTVCEKCSGTLMKIIAPTSFHLKGGGWYKDLYSSKKGGSGSAAKGEDRSDAKSDSTAEAKTETKGESKAEPKTEAKAAPKADSKPSAGSGGSDK